jgi:hypothetical protein
MSPIASIATARPATVVVTLSITLRPEVAPVPASTVLVVPGMLVAIWMRSFVLFAVELRFAADTTGFPACAAAGTSMATVRTSGRASRRTAAWYERS